jgi:hypothetical protein
MQDQATEQQLAHARGLLEQRQRARAQLPLTDFVPANTPGYMSPTHLAPYTSVLDSVQQKPQLFTVTAPPRHGKTETTLAGCAKLLRRNPRLRIAYAAYSLLVSYERSKLCAEMARRAGVKFAGSKPRAALWRTDAGGCFFATGTGGAFTSFGFDLIIVDDPHKDRAEADSSLKRQRVHDWFSSTAGTRLEPGGSIVVTHTRWHPDDLIGHLLAADKALPEARRQWDPYAFPVRYAGEDGIERALWPERYPLEALQRIQDRTTKYDWWSLYMCSPRPRGDQVFDGVTYYTELPKQGIRYGIGVDLAYTASTQADHSVAVVMAESGGKFFVVEVLRRQCAAPKFAAELKELAGRYPSAKMLTYAYGPEKGSVDFIRKLGLKRLSSVQASGDKFVRASPLAAAWNAGDVQVPQSKLQAFEEMGAADPSYVEHVIAESPELGEEIPKDSDEFPFVSPLLKELRAFTGMNDPHDDQVDALAAAFDVLGGLKVTSGEKHKPLPPVGRYVSPLDGWGEPEPPPPRR